VIKLSSAFDLAFARLCGEAPAVGPTKAPAPAADADLDRAFRAWDEVPFDALVDQMSTSLVEGALAEFDDAPTEVFARPLARAAGAR
jgi:hypothetical protein